jgi:hypothetical protein
MWKTVDNFLTPIEACSACGGDYEDPDRTAWTDEEHEDAADLAGEPRGGELLARNEDAREEAERCGGL